MNVRALLTLNVNSNLSRCKGLMCFRPTWVEISKKAFQSNARELSKFVGPNVELLAVLKADGYGHGAAVLAPMALRSGAASIGVSSLEEGISLREAGITSPILILGGIFPLANFSVAIAKNLIPTVASHDAAIALSRIAKEKNRRCSLHLKVDTGMGRIGVSVEEAKRIIPWISHQSHLSLDGIYSHLSCADSDAAFTKKQIAQIGELKKFSSAMGFLNIKFHISNSAGMLRFKGAHFDVVRPGLALYGVSQVSLPRSVKLFPVLSWHTKIIYLKKVNRGTPISYGGTFVAKKATQIATLPVGYADGVPRMVSNAGHVLIKGKRCSIVGRVTMDQIMVDVTGRSVQVGDPVVLLGHQEGQCITAHDWARWAGTIPYEIFCGISKRVPRIMREI